MQLIVTATLDMVLHELWQRIRSTAIRQACVSGNGASSTGNRDPEDIDGKACRRTRRQVLAIRKKKRRCRVVYKEIVVRAQHPGAPKRSIVGDSKSDEKIVVVEYKMVLIGQTSGERW